MDRADASGLANIPGRIRIISANAKLIATYKHGSHTDAQWKLGRMDIVREQRKTPESLDESARERLFAS